MSSLSDIERSAEALRRMGERLTQPTARLIREMEERERQQAALLDRLRRQDEATKYRMEERLRQHDAIYRRMHEQDYIDRFRSGILSQAISTGETSSLQPSSPELQASIRQNQLEVQVQQLREQTSDLAEAVKRGEKTERELRENLERLTALDELRHIYYSISELAQGKLLADADFVKQFTQPDCRAFVISIDIRKSTDLMLMAVTKQKFADFITDLCSRLRDAVIQNCGVFDKFTGDGILAFFPEFYSGPDAGYLSLRAAEQSHRTFAEVYRCHRRSFDTLPKDTGLGIGIDYGEVALVKGFGGLTVVGKPVVYACRYGGAPARYTLLNNQAHAVVFDKYSGYCHLVETELPVKGQGIMHACQVSLNGKEYHPTVADWMKAGTEQSTNTTEVGDAVAQSQNSVTVNDETKSTQD